MSAGNFEASLALTLVYEGGWSDHPLDPGGATMCGVTQKVYDAYRDAQHLPRQSVRLSTPAERAAIYRQRYWSQAACDRLPTGVDFALFDFAVNSGVRRAVRTLQGIINEAPDGIAGSFTVASATRYCITYTASALTDALCQARLRFLQGLPTFSTFGAGWTRRVMGAHAGAQADDTGVIDHAFAMATGAAVSATRAPMATPKTFLAVAA
jgi:lysozyme family protein